MKRTNRSPIRRREKTAAVALEFFHAQCRQNGNEPATEIVALGRKFDTDLRIDLVRHADFARKVRFIMVEFGRTAQPPILDCYIQG
jgi:hypothetical protein